MVDIRCYKCGAISSGSTVDDARAKMNHAIGLSRGIYCGDNYNCIEEINVSTKSETPKIEPDVVISNSIKSKSTKLKSN